MDIVNRICASRGLRKKIADSRDRLYSVAFSWCGDSMLADDLTQETVILALQRVHQLRDRERLNAWMYRILSNCWKHHLRSRKPDMDIEEADIPCSDDTPETMSAELEVVNRVRLAILKLPPGQRQAITLVDLEGFAYAEVAEILDIPIGTVMSRIYTSRNTLEKRLESFRSQPPARTPYLRRVK